MLRGTIPADEVLEVAECACDHQKLAHREDATLDCAGYQLTDTLYPAETGRTILDEQRVDSIGLFQRIPHFIGVALRLERKELFARLLAHAPFRCPGNDLVQLQRFQITCFHSNSLY